MIIKVSFMVIASVTALKISQTKRNGAIKSSGTLHEFEHEFEERENRTTNTNNVTQNEEEKQVETELSENLVTGEFEDLKLLIYCKKKDYVTEKELLQNFKQRKENLERKLLELNGLKEEQSAISQIQRQLEIKTAKFDILKKTIASLKTEMEIIQEKIRQDLLLKKQVDITKKMINEMQMQKDANANRVKEQILMMQKQVTELQKHNRSGRNSLVNKKLEDLQEIELEVLKLKRRNKEIELEKREMGVKLATNQARIITEEEKEIQMKQEITGLQHVHEELSDQVERLQRNRFNMVEELVYQRWLYACLRFELHNHQNQSKKTTRRVNSKKEFYAKTHNSSKSDPEIESISSSVTTLDESDETETTTFESSSSSQSSSSKNSRLFNRLKRWKKTKDYGKNISSKGRNFPGLIRRFSMSMVESDLSENVSHKSLEKVPIIMRKLKRVSFSDSVKSSTYEDVTDAIEDVIDDKETCSEKIMDLNSSILSWDEHDAEQCYEHEAEQCDCIKNDPIVEKEDLKNQIGHSGELCSRNEIVCGKGERIKISFGPAGSIFLLYIFPASIFHDKIRIAFVNITSNV